MLACILPFLFPLSLSAGCGYCPGVATFDRQLYGPRSGYFPPLATASFMLPWPTHQQCLPIHRRVHLMEHHQSLARYCQQPFFVVVVD